MQTLKPYPDAHHDGIHFNTPPEGYEKHEEKQNKSSVEFGFSSWLRGEITTLIMG
jgi:hypothetical protein